MDGHLSYLEGPKQVGTAVFALPSPVASDVLVEVSRAHVCGSDVNIWRGTHATLTSPPLGHEFVGTVLAVGPDARTDRAGTPLAVGDRVVATYFPVCQTCSACAAGIFGACERVYAYRGAPRELAPHFHGAFASHYYVHGDQHLFRVPDTVSDEAAAVANCGLATVLQAVDIAAPPAEGGVATVIGLGGLGQLACAALTASGWRVLAVDPVEERQSLALEFGAVVVTDDTRRVAPLLDDLGAERGPALVVDVCGIPGELARAIELVAPHGTILELGIVDSGEHLDARVTPSSIVRKQATVRGSFRYHPTRLHRALEFLAGPGSALPFADLSPRPFGLDEVQGALESAAAHEQVRVALSSSGGPQ